MPTTAPVVETPGVTTTTATTTPAPAAPAPVEIELDGKKLSVQPEVAAALKVAKDAAAAAGVAAKEVETRLNAQLEELRKKLPGTPAATPNPEDDLDTLLFTNPKEAAKRIKEEAKAEIRAEIGVTTAQTNFWTDFYGEFPELKDDDLVVKAIMNRDYEDLRPLKVPEAIKKLGESAQKYLMDRGVERKKQKKDPGTEGGNQPSARGPKKAEGERSQTAPSLSQVLKERQQARREAQAGVKTA
jgi:hypothetical protein